PTAGHSSNPGPLPWLPGIPPTLATHEKYGPYLNARADLIHALVVDVREQANHCVPTTAPPWATHLNDPAHEQLPGDLAVWRGAADVPPPDRRPTRPPLGDAPERPSPRTAAWRPRGMAGRHRCPDTGPAPHRRTPTRRRGRPGP